MSKIAIEGNSLGTGTLTIAAPNTNSNFTLDIPSASGTIDRLNRAGNVLQVVSTKYDGSSGGISTSSTSYVDSNIDLTITPSSASNKVLVRAFVQIFLNTQGHAKIAIYRNDTTEIIQSSIIFTSAGTIAGQGMIEILDSPNTTSATTYSIYFLASAGTATINGESNSDAGITAMEIAA